MFIRTLLSCLALILSLTACTSNLVATLSNTNSTLVSYRADIIALDQRWLEAQERETAALALQLEQEERGYLGDDLWALVEEDYEFVPKYYGTPQAQRHIRALKKNREFLAGVNERAALFLYFIREELLKRGMPSELAVLPMVESSYDPYAYSHAGASGLWQFTERTGREYELHDIWWYAERRDFEEATRAALDYLQYLHNKYNDWELALAAYNLGETRLNRAIRYNRNRNRPTDYWSVRALIPYETRYYVPRLVAYAYLFTTEQRAELGFRKIPAQRAWRKLRLPQQVNLERLVETSGVEREDFYLLNAGHNQWVTSPYKEELYVTYEDYDKLSAALAELAGTESHWVSYKIEAQDTIESIAAKFGLTPDHISHYNEVEDLAAGNFVILPFTNRSGLDWFEFEEPPRHLVSNVRIKEHQIKRGENLSSIARRYRVSVQKLQRLNGISNPHKIRAGARLTVDASAVVKKSTVLLAADYERTVIRDIHYRIRRGDTLTHIAAKFGVSVADILDWNPQRNLSRGLYAGRWLRLKLDVTDL